MGGHQDCRSTKRVRIRNRKAGRTGRRISQVGRPRGGREKNRGSSEVAKGRKREITKGGRGGNKEKDLRSPKRKGRKRKKKEGMEAKLNADITKLRKQNKESELKMKERE